MLAQERGSRLAREPATRQPGCGVRGGLSARHQQRAGVATLGSPRLGLAERQAARLSRGRGRQLGVSAEVLVERGEVVDPAAAETRLVA